MLLVVVSYAKATYEKSRIDAFFRSSVQSQKLQGTSYSDIKKELPP